MTANGSLIQDGTVISVASDPEHRFSKTTRENINLIEGHGVEGDAHAGRKVKQRFLARTKPWLANFRQIHLMPSELFDDLRADNFFVGPGELGENVTTAGVHLVALPLGTFVSLGQTAVVEITGLRTPCVLIDRFRKGLKKKMIGRENGDPVFKCGVLGVVRAGGRVAAGDVIRAELPCRPWKPLPKL
jgi:hypothetical protein